MIKNSTYPDGCFYNILKDRDIRFLFLEGSSSCDFSHQIHKDSTHIFNVVHLPFTSNTSQCPASFQHIINQVVVGYGKCRGLNCKGQNPSNPFFNIKYFYCWSQNNLYQIKLYSTNLGYGKRLWGSIHQQGFSKDMDT